MEYDVIKTNLESDLKIGNWEAAREKVKKMIDDLPLNIELNISNELLTKIKKWEAAFVLAQNIENTKARQWALQALAEILCESEIISIEKLEDGEKATWTLHERDEFPIPPPYRVVRRVVRRVPKRSK